MRYIKLLILSLVTLMVVAVNSVFGQNYNILSAEYDFRVTVSPSGAGTYGMNGFFLDSDGLGYTVSDIVLDSTYYTDSSGKQFLIKSTSGASPIEIGVDPVGHSSSPTTGIGQLYRGTKNFNFPLETGAVTPALRGHNERRTRILVDSLLARTEESFTPTQDTATISGFTPTLFMPVHTGSDGVTLSPADTSKFASYLIIEIISPTEVIISHEGVYETTIDNGVYYTSAVAGVATDTVYSCNRQFLYEVREGKLHIDVQDEIRTCDEVVISEKPTRFSIAKASIVGYEDEIALTGTSTQILTIDDFNSIEEMVLIVDQGTEYDANATDFVLQIVDSSGETNAWNPSSGTTHDLWIPDVYVLDGGATTLNSQEAAVYGSGDVMFDNSPNSFVSWTNSTLTIRFSGAGFKSKSRNIITLKF